MSKPVDCVSNGAPDDGTGRVPRLYVGIGGSAGSLKALEAFLEALDDPSDLCLIVVTHRGPDPDALLSQLLASHTDMSVSEPQTTTRALAGRIYVCPAGSDIYLQHGQLHCEPNHDALGERTTIDRLLVSLAEDQGARAAGIVLSGTGHDATQGIKAIQQAGGLTIAQTPDEAAYPEMPERAIQSGFITQILAVARMPGVLADPTATMHETPPDAGHDHRTAPADDRDSEEHDNPGDNPGDDSGDDSGENPGDRHMQDAILSVINSRHGRDFFHYKRGTIARRIARRMDITQTADLETYLEMVRARPDESANLLSDLRIGVTAFFRDTEAFEFLENEIVPGLVGRPESDDAPLRIWVPGCASGEEAYSLAMIFSEALQATGSNRDLQLFATDIDEPALIKARQGVYSEKAVAEIAPERRKRWFETLDNGVRITRELRARVIFAAQSVIADPPFSRLDMISCRNVLIYLEKPMQQQVIGLFHFALRTDGCLFLGNSENIDSRSPLFAATRPGMQVYKARVAAGTRSYRLDWMQPGNERSNPLSGLSDTHIKAGSRGGLSEQVPRLLVDSFAPASVVTNERFELLYLHGNLGDFLSFPTGAPTDDLLRMARRGIDTRLRRLVATVLADGGIASERARISRDDEQQYRDVEIRAQRFFSDAGGAMCVLLSFRETSLTSVPAVSLTAGEDDDSDYDDSDYVLHLEQQIRAARDENTRLNDELQATRQEFKTTHEEALSINEELQSSNEELESSKEELQSLNEELSTVNDELKEKMTALREASTDIENLLDSTDIATIFLDTEHQVKRFTPQARGLFNLIDSDAGRPLSDISHVFAQAFDIDAEAEQVQKSRQPVEHETPTHDGRWFLRRTTPYRAADETVEGAVLSFLDVTALKQAERTAAASDTRFRAIYDNNPAMYFILDRQGHIASVNEFGAAQLGYRPAELTGRAFETLHEQPDHLRDKLERCLSNPDDILRWEVQLRSKMNDVMWVRANARRVEALGEAALDENDAGILISCENITQERHLGEEAHFHATHDALTGLLNRREFERLLALAMDSVRTEDRTHTLAYLDLDNFKIINDTYGHEAGDELLRQITQRMRESLQQRDLLARIGGDEFALLMEDRNSQQAHALARNLVKTIQETDYLWRRQRLRVDTCIGLAPIHPGAGDVAAVMRAADAACFSAKELGPGSVHEHSEQDLRINRRRDEMSWAEQLRSALEENRIELHAQSIVSLDEPNGHCGYECLLRLRTRDGELILPGRFMDAANRYGLIRDLDRRALDLLLQFLAAAGERLKPMRWIAVNLSATSLIHPDFLSTVTAALDESGVDSSLLCFEITETSVISNLSQAQQFMRELQKRGCSFALDDFGTGLSSFDYLRELPVEYVKIDGSFIRDMLDDPPDRAMVEAIVEITRMMGKATIAEWVESPALLAEVQKMDIDYAQGYHFARPAPLDQVLLED